MNDFASIVSHDLKAPLRGIQTMADWLVSDYADKLDDKGKENLEMIQERSLRMTDLINGILSYSRAGRIQEDRTGLDLETVVHEAIDLLAPPSSIEIVVETPMPTVRAEKVQVSQVFQNLLGNAVKYMDKTEGHVKVGCLAQNDSWHFYVADDGPGVEEQYHERIFQMFSTAPHPEGKESTGVDLAIVKKIVEGMGGRIWVQSSPGQGGTFTFALPQKSAVMCDAKSAT